MSHLLWNENVRYRLCKSNFSWRASVLKHRPTLGLEGHALWVVRCVSNILPAKDPILRLCPELAVSNTRNT